jgi:hypothetical protein
MTEGGPLSPELRGDGDCDLFIARIFGFDDIASNTDAEALPRQKIERRGAALMSVFLMALIRMPWLG